MKRFLSALLVLCLLCVAGVSIRPAAADDQADARIWVYWLNADGSILDYKSYVPPAAEPTTDKIPEEIQPNVVFDRWDSGTVEGNTKTYKGIYKSLKPEKRDPEPKEKPTVPPVCPGYPTEPCKPYNQPEPAQPPRQVHATEVIEDGAVYKLEDSTGTAILKELTTKRNKKSLKIPDTVSANGRVYKVTRIDADACSNVQTLQEVTIGANVEKIYKRAFWQCPKLKAITFKGKKLLYIGENAFAEISGKATATVPGGFYSDYKEMLLGGGFPETGTITK